MSMEWFNRVTGELQDHLNSICEEYDQIGQMTIDQSAKHPRVEFFVETEGNERDYFCTLLFDPHNEEFYVETFDYEFEQPARIILADIEDVIDAVHDSFHDFINGDSDMFVAVDGNDDDEDDEFLLEDDDEEEYYIGEIVEEENMLNEVEIEWETPEVTAFQIEDEVEVTYQFGVVSTTGNGVLRRVNRFWSEDDEFYKEESALSFTKEEASTIIAMIASNMDKMTSYEDM
ncbi:hypothetical protein [Paenisporosarcina sp. OV554]|uniref:hypothetical protein n=1 Tax=Paenisporosarcina sp. OV554 TaxID=2135694 RepID=UPI000D344C79|nr:hypothetical protein [Paenisporosarcina sp. OV554]